MTCVWRSPCASTTPLSPRPTCCHTSTWRGGPANDCAARLGGDLADLTDPRPSDAALFLDLPPISGPHVFAEFLETAGMVANGIPVERRARRTILSLEHRFDYSFQQRYVAVDANLQQAV